jgi:S1-C subfamily serine protease
MMKWVIAGLMLLFGPENAPTLTPSEIFTKNKDAIVQIFVNGELSGCGFIISADGLVITANHVVTTEESNFTQTFSTIEVRKLGQRSHFATVVTHSDVSDTALLRIIADNLPYVALGSAQPIQPSSAATMITFLPDSRWNLPLLITGTVSGTGVVGLGKVRANTIILQMPIRKGLSGSPIFNEKGQVIAIINTRLIGISADLDAARRELKAAQPNVRVTMAGADIGKTFLGLINSLDADLVSGLGSAIDIAYAKQMIADAEKNKEK